jgi:hypothetical protein
MELSEMQLQPLQDEPFIPDSLSLLKDSSCGSHFFLQVTQALLELDVEMGQRLLYDTLQQTNIDIGNSTIPSFCSRSFPRGN